MTSDRLKSIGVSPTMKVSARAKELKAEGLDVVDFSVGEPDFPTPEHIKNAAIKAIEQNHTKYTLNSGILALKKAIINKYIKESSSKYEQDEVIVTNGGKQGLFNAVLSIVNPGDEVLLPSPYWVSYPHMVSLAGGKSVFIPTEEKNSFKLSPAILENAITDKTKLLILNNPSNPTGSAYSKEELRSLAELLRSRDIWVISDEIYEKLLYADYRYCSFAEAAPFLRDRTITINGVSKAYAMTGWRIGYALGPKDVISGMNKIQSHSTSNASSISQYAALEALNGPQETVEEMRLEFLNRRDYMLSAFLKMPGVSCFRPEGAFYLFPNFSSYFGKSDGKNKIENSSDLALYFLNKALVATVPGIAFGQEGHIRLSYATSMQNIKEGMKRIEEALAKLS